MKQTRMIWEGCAKAMQNKSLSRLDYESTIYNDPIGLLKAVTEHALSYQEKRYEMSIVSDALRAVISTKQKDSESLQDYMRQFKTFRNFLESPIGGALILLK